MSGDIPTPVVIISITVMFVSGFMLGFYARKATIETICDHHYKLRSSFEKCIVGTIPKGENQQ